MSSDPDDAETTYDKGDRNETEACNILARVYGTANVDKVARYGTNDPLRFIDVLGCKQGWPTRFVQVKTNRFTAKDKRRYKGIVKRFSEGVVCEVWVRIDYDGWEFYRYDPDAHDWVRYLKMETCDYEQTVAAFREAVGYDPTSPR